MVSWEHYSNEAIEGPLEVYLQTSKFFVSDENKPAMNK